MSQEITFLLLGAAESGKSTFIRQMCIIQGQGSGFGFKNEEKEEFKKFIYRNIFMAMQAIIRTMDHLQIQYENPEMEEKASLILSINLGKIHK